MGKKVLTHGGVQPKPDGETDTMVWLGKVRSFRTAKHYHRVGWEYGRHKMRRGSEAMMLEKEIQYLDLRENFKGKDRNKKHPKHHLHNLEGGGQGNGKGNIREKNRFLYEITACKCSYNEEKVQKRNSLYGI